MPRGSPRFHLPVGGLRVARVPLVLSRPNFYAEHGNRPPAGFNWSRRKYIEVCKANAREGQSSARLGYHAARVAFRRKVRRSNIAFSPLGMMSETLLRAMTIPGGRPARVCGPSARKWSELCKSGAPNACRVAPGSDRCSKNEGSPATIRGHPRGVRTREDRAKEKDDGEDLLS